jgi:hypothetical protein
MLCLDVSFQGLLLSKCLVAWWIFGAVELGLVHVPVSLQPAIRCEALPAALPLAYKCSHGCRIVVRILQVSLEVVFAGKRLVTARLRACEGSLLVVAAHVGFEAAWSVEALVAAVHGTGVVPLAASLAVCSECAIVGVVDLVVFGFVRLPAHVFLLRVV